MRVKHDDGGSEELCTVRGQAERMARVRWENEKPPRVQRQETLGSGQRPCNAADKHANITITKY